MGRARHKALCCRICKQQLTKLQTINKNLTHYIRSLPPPTPKTGSFALPDKFDGNVEQCKGFIHQLQVYLDHQGESFKSEGKKCAFIMTLLTGRAIDWESSFSDLSYKLLKGEVEKVDKPTISLI
uniref:DUF4939 domain-containing protein n=1 Tax=Cyprinus carpio TaxID=7962 RepID=A0A8C1TW10_CYPCA